MDAVSLVVSCFPTSKHVLSICHSDLIQKFELLGRAGLKIALHVMLLLIKTLDGNIFILH